MTHSRTKWLLGLMSLLMLLTLSACGDKLDTKIYIGDEMQTNKSKKQSITCTPITTAPSSQVKYQQATSKPRRLYTIISLRIKKRVEAG